MKKLPMFENKIGIGAQAEIYLVDDNAVKLFREGYDESFVRYEADMMALIEKTGLPIPKVREILNLNGRMAIKMDHIPGGTLSERIEKEPEKFMKYIGLMVDLQQLVFTKTPPLVVTLKQRLYEKIKNCLFLEESERGKVLEKLSLLPDGNCLCHGDFHSYNILMNGDKPYIIDWIDATVGCPQGDVCRSWMLLALYHKEAADGYLDVYCQKARKSREDVLKWLPVIAAARLSEGFEQEKEQLLHWMK